MCAAAPTSLAPDFRATTPLRLALALILAVLIHAALFALPVEIPEIEERKRPIHFKIIRSKKTGAIQKVEAKPRRSTETQQIGKTTAEPANPKPTNTLRNNSSPPPQQPEPKQQPRPGADRQIIREPQPAQGAKSKAAVFDPRLAKKLAEERNKVHKYQPRNAEFITANGTFIQRGDYCAEIRELVPMDIDSHVTQEFKITCSKTSRPAEDIDTLARKYGIP